MVEAWIYAGNCPICGCGLRRLRACSGASATPGLHGYILCDDCETMWLEPDVRSPHSFPDAESPACPVCGQPLFGPQARWASLQDLYEIGWQDECVVEPMNRVEAGDDLLEPEDFAADLDAPEPIPVHHRDQHGNHDEPSKQIAEVMPQLDRGDEAAEPKPGC